MVLKDEMEEIISIILEYNPPSEIDEWIAKESDNIYDKTIRTFFMLRVLANTQKALLHYYICLYGGKIRKEKKPEFVRTKRKLSARKKSLEKVINEVKRIQESMQEMTDDQRILYKKEHLSDLEHILQYYLSIVQKTEVEYGRKFRKHTRKKFSTDRWWNWFRFTELGKNWRN